MRHWLLALMIALLPLRGWVGDAMAMSMWAPAAPLGAPLPCHGAPTDGHHAVEGDAPAQPGESVSATTHTACDVCHGPAMAAGARAGEIRRMPQTRRAPSQVRFASALAVGEIKPPIA